MKTEAKRSSKKKKKKKVEELEKCCVRGDKDEVKELHPGLSNMGVTDQSNYDGVLSPAQAADGDSEHE